MDDTPNIGDRRYVVLEDGGACTNTPMATWYVRVDEVVSIDEYEPGFPVLDVTWDQHGDYLGPFDSEEEAQEAAKSEVSRWPSKMTFRAIAERARTERTESATLALLAKYADNECATFPVDSDLFREVWPDERPPGFRLHPYEHLNTHTVTVE